MRHDPRRDPVQVAKSAPDWEETAATRRVSLSHAPGEGEILPNPSESRKKPVELKSAEMEGFAMYARDLMTTNVIRIASSVTIGQAVQLLKEHTISGLPVVDEQGRLIGVITGGDVLRAFQQRAQRVYHTLIGPTHVVIDHAVYLHDREELLSLPVEKMMSRGAVTVGLDSQVGDITDIMLRQNVRRVFVLEQKKLRGVITRNDIVRWLVTHVEDDMP
ncbi:MAG: CBS domain-containing protein [Thermaerobacter sp.]|nr:CBS domain-containing protein [Thermaerobacter sp.]